MHFNVLCGQEYFRQGFTDNMFYSRRILSDKVLHYMFYFSSIFLINFNFPFNGFDLTTLFLPNSCYFCSRSLCSLSQEDDTCNSPT